MNKANQYNSTIRISKDLKDKLKVKAYVDGKTLFKYVERVLYDNVHNNKNRK